MDIRKLFFFIIMFLSFLYTRDAFAQGVEAQDSIDEQSNMQAKTGPQVHYSIGSSFLHIPKHGSITGLTASSFLLFPVTHKLSVEGGIIAGRYFPVLKNFTPELQANNSYNTLSLYGSANYQVNRHLSFYGTGIKQLGVPIPLYNQPSGSYSFGSNLNFGNFTIGAEIRMTDWDDNYFPSPFDSNMRNFSSYPW